jgi:hypothetical protein
MRKPRHLEERSIETFFAGQAMPDPADAALVAFAQSVRSLAQQAPPVPTGALAAVLVSGLDTHLGVLPEMAAHNLPKPAPQANPLLKRRPRMSLSSMLAAIFAKLGALGLAAKTIGAVALAAVGMTAAGAAGALPAPVQGAVASVVSAVTPFSFPTTANSHAAFGGKTATSAVTNHGVSGAAQSAAAKKQGATESADAKATASSQKRPATAGRPASPGSQSAFGLGIAGSTRAAGHVPTSVPTASSSAASSNSTGAGSSDIAGSQSAFGLGIAGSTPAAGQVPTSVPTASTTISASSGSPSSTASSSSTQSSSAGSSQSAFGLGIASATRAAGHVPTR